MGIDDSVDEVLQEYNIQACNTTTTHLTKNVVAVDLMLSLRSG